MKNLYTLILPAMMFFSIACSQNDDAQFPQKSNDAYKYTFVEKYEPLQGQIIEPSVDVKIDKHYFDNGITRTKLTIRPENDQKVTVTETWTTRKPSLTAAGIAAYTALYGSAAAAGLYLASAVGTYLGTPSDEQRANYEVRMQRAQERDKQIWQTHKEIVMKHTQNLNEAFNEGIAAQQAFIKMEEGKQLTEAEEALLKKFKDQAYVKIEDFLENFIHHSPMSAEEQLSREEQHEFIKNSLLN